ncbi:hypothetical protein [Capnocytophaga sputigena]|uniref:hypothetical protein n=1 Tax=Capnocytophaga sputigena TaxID=1019 RepID=UPI0028E2865C|nr:hypothetical protein [Capnocytophaga sputigena]
MGNLYITAEGVSRLRNLRSRKRIAREDHEKFLRTCIKHQKALFKQRRELPLVPLEKPYQKGYVRFFVLREDVRQGKQADFFATLLEKINTYQYADTRKFQKKKKRRGKRVYIARKQELYSFSQWEWERALERGKFTQKERAYFAKIECFNRQKDRFEIHYEFTEAWRFELRVKPNMITHYRPVDIAIERELAELDKIIDDYKNWGIIHSKIYGRSYSWRQYQKRYMPKEKYKRTPLKEITALKYHTSAMEIADMLLEVNL